MYLRKTVWWIKEGIFACPAFVQKRVWPADVNSGASLAAGGVGNTFQVRTRARFVAGSPAPTHPRVLWVPMVSCQGACWHAPQCVLLLPERAGVEVCKEALPSYFLLIVNS